MKNKTDGRDRDRLKTIAYLKKKNEKKNGQKQLKEIENKS